MIFVSESLRFFAQIATISGVTILVSSCGEERRFPDKAGDDGGSGLGGSGLGGSSGTGGDASGGAGECAATSLVCGDTCCGAEPANGTTACEDGACVVRCNTGFNACGGASSQCYPEDDPAHCGAGCLDCTQPNAVSACVAGQCQNTCLGYTFPCAAADGKPACGSWDFESQTVEGWIVANGTETDVMAPPSAFTGELGTGTARTTSGQRALTVGFEGDGADTFAAELKLRLCPSGQALDLRGRTLSLDVYPFTANGTTPFAWVDCANYLITWNGSTQVTGQCDFNMEPDQFYSATCAFGDSDSAITDVSLLLRVFAPWQGTFYVDNIRFD